MSKKHLSFKIINGIHVLRLQSDDGMNRLTTACVLELTNVLDALAGHMQALIITGNQKFFSAGADLREIAALNSPSGLKFFPDGSAFDEFHRIFPRSSLGGDLGILHGWRA